MKDYDGDYGFFADEIDAFEQRLKKGRTCTDPYKRIPKLLRSRVKECVARYDGYWIVLNDEWSFWGEDHFRTFSVKEMNSCLSHTERNEES